MPPKRAEDYFNFLARVGLTKHYGSLDATMELIELTRIKSARSFYKNGTSGLSMDIINYVGYGVYAGQKPCY